MSNFPLWPLAFLWIIPCQAGTLAPDFIIYLNRFAHEASIRGVRLDSYRANNTNIKFGFDLSDYNTLAQCNTDTFQISVSESYWLTASDIEREELLFHELGHCILGRSHEDGTMPITDGFIYKSVMNSAGNALMARFANCSSNFNDCGKSLVLDPKSKNNFYRKFHKIYMDELFGAFAPNELAPQKAIAKKIKPKKEELKTESGAALTSVPSSPPSLRTVKLKRAMKKSDILSALGQPVKVEDGIKMPHVGFWGAHGTIFLYDGGLCNKDSFQVPECNLGCYSHWEGISAGQCAVAFDGDELVYIYNFKPQFLDLNE